MSTDNNEQNRLTGQNAADEQQIMNIQEKEAGMDEGVFRDLDEEEYEEDKNILLTISEEEDIEEIVEEYYPPRTNDPFPKEEEEIIGNAMGQDDIPADCLGYETSKKMFSDILKVVWNHAGPFTIICEAYNVNPIYRDSYYNYFAGQHFDVSRFVDRFFFFQGMLTEEDVFSYGSKEKLETAFIGTFIIYPTEAKTIGRILFKPEFLIAGTYPCYMRIIDYSVSVFGIRLSICAFPHQMQDRETTRCAEVTLLNIMDYYGNLYTEYSTLLPGEIVQLEKQFTMDRTLPSRGINYMIMSKILTRCGLSPRLYSRQALRKEFEVAPSEEWQANEMRRIMHYYVESGIPVALNVAKASCKLPIPGHSLICIGYQDKKEERIENEQLGGIVLYNAADFYHNYILIDDNQKPYSIKEYNSLSLYPDYQVENLLVPLYKKMYLEAADAYDMARYIIEHESFGLSTRCRFVVETRKEIVVRLFLASSRTYKKFRIENSGSQTDLYRQLYGEIPFPRFVWVAELFTKENYLDPEGTAFGEYILDATASNKNDAKSIIMLNYPDSVCVRWPDWPITALNEQYYPDFRLAPFPRFNGNLTKICSLKYESVKEDAGN